MLRCIVNKYQKFQFSTYFNSGFTDLKTFFLLAVFWVTALAPTIIGFLNHTVSTEYAYWLKICIHIFYIAIMIFFLKFITKDQKIRILFYVIVLLGVSELFRDYRSLNTFFDYLHGIKVYFFPLLYLFIIKNQIQSNNDFAFKLKQHIIYIFFLTLIVSFFEIFLSRFDPSNSIFQDWIHLSQSIPPEFYGRPNGITQDSHGGAFILSIAAIYYFINRRIFISTLFVSVVILSAIKTWWIGMTFSFIVYYLFNFNNKTILKNLLFILIVQTIVFYLSSAIDTYVANLTLKSHGEANIMYELYTNINNYLLLSIFPHGFVFESIYLSDAYSLYILYQLGIIVGLIYIFMLFGDFRFQNIYWPIIVFCFFTMIHTSPLNYIFIMFIYGYFLYYPSHRHSQSK